MGSVFFFFYSVKWILNICPACLTCLLLIIPQRIRWDNEFESTSKSTHKVSDRYKVFLVFLLLIALQLPFLRRRNILFLLTISPIFSTLYPPCGAVWQQPLALCILSSKTRLLDLGEWQSGAWSRGFWVHSYQLLFFSSPGLFPSVSPMDQYSVAWLGQFQDTNIQVGKDIGLLGLWFRGQRWRRWSKSLHPFFYCLCNTVIGPKVSLVARMITAYPGLVSCDEVTYLRSMLPAYNFKKLPEKMMKNISNPGKMYEYVGHRRCMWVSLCDNSLPSVL